MVDTISIVGHGPSLKDKKLGKIIDKNKVVRLKGCIFNEDFGHQTHVICASTEVMGLFKRSYAEEYWAYPKKGSFDGEQALNVMIKLQSPVLIPLYHCEYWNRRFRLMGASHPNVSTGMAAIIISIQRLKPDVIKLFGFDTLLDPSLDFDRYQEVPRSGIGEYPAHDWEMENKLLGILENVYKVTIESGH